ncbi:MAG: hypothetical protein KBS79_01915, partial [Lachnospiraceae bacterium]|nr:hypothetical protein [Candidatus Minthocola equi]
KKDAAQGEYYFNTIEGYKLIVENKNHIINEYENTIKKLENYVAFLKAETDKKTTIINNLQDHVKWMEGMITKAK